MQPEVLVYSNSCQVWFSLLKLLLKRRFSDIITLRHHLTLEILIHLMLWRKQWLKLKETHYTATTDDDGLIRCAWAQSIPGVSNEELPQKCAAVRHV